MRLLSGLLALSALALGASAIAGSVSPVFAALALVVAAVLWLAGRLPGLMRFLIGLYALSFLGLAVVSALAQVGAFPEAAGPYLPPASAAIVAALLVFAHYGICFVRLVRQVIDLAAPYFDSAERSTLNLGFTSIRLPERWVGLGFLSLIVGVNVVQVYMNVLFSFWNNRFYTALQDKNVGAFWSELLYFSLVAFFWISAGIFEVYVTALFQVRWRRWMTEHYIGQWLGDHVHYRLGVEGQQADNPDQRIADDVREFITTSRQTYIQIFSTALNLYAFVQILWGISAEFSYSIGGFDLSRIPGYLVWFALGVSIIATVGTHLIGRPLIPLNFRQQKVEADFRFNLVRVRENTEQIALLKGEPVEERGLMGRFAEIYENTIAIVIRQIKLTCFTLAFNQIMVPLPFVFLAPAYFTNAAMKLGTLTQTSQAFGNVQSAFSFFVDAYSTLAVYKSVIDRLTGFESAMVRAETERQAGIRAEPGEGVGAEGLTVRLPDGRPLMEEVGFEIPRGVRTLLTGQSGSGKTTLFRALAGLWPFGSGRVHAPRDEGMMLLPQQPYLPLGSLKAALTYPRPADTVPDEAVREALARVGLDGLAGRLHDAENWTRALSGGEKQRVAMVRALLARPRWLLLDEATSALDEPGEASLYAMLREALPDTTIVSIGHRSSLAALHDRRVAIERTPEGSRIVEAPLAAFGRPAGA